MSFLLLCTSDVTNIRTFLTFAFALTGGEFSREIGINFYEFSRMRIFVTLLIST